MNDLDNPFRPGNPQIVGGRVLICGGRNYLDWPRFRAAVDNEHGYGHIKLIIHGGASGADSLAHRWCKLNAIPSEVYPALWREQGKAAGPLRNQRMLDEGKPDVVLAFLGGRGTADMVRRARAAGVPVIEHG